MNAHTKQQQDKVFEKDFIDSQPPPSPFCAPFGTKSYIFLSLIVSRWHHGLQMANEANEVLLGISDRLLGFYRRSEIPGPF